MNKRVEVLSKLISYDNNGKFIRLIDFPVWDSKTKTPDGYQLECIEWSMLLASQTEKAIRILKVPKKLPAVEIEDINLLNYLQLLMGQELSELPLKQETSVPDSTEAPK